MKISWLFTHPQAIQDVYDFLSSVEENLKFWRKTFQVGVGDMEKISYHDSWFYHDSLSCWFYYFASCLSITAKLISLL